MYTISCERTFEAGHSLPLLPKDHKCHGIHGHSYRVVVELRGEIDERGFVEDYGDVKVFLDAILRNLDHQYLNPIIPNPTTEAISKYIYDQLKLTYEKLCAVTVYETPGNACKYAP